MNKVVSLPILRAKHIISQYLQNEKGKEANFDDLSQIPIESVKTEDGLHEMKTCINLIQCCVETYLDGKRVNTCEYESVDEMNRLVMPFLAYSELIRLDNWRKFALGDTCWPAYGGR